MKCFNQRLALQVKKHVYRIPSVTYRTDPNLPNPRENTPRIGPAVLFRGQQRVREIRELCSYAIMLNFIYAGKNIIFYINIFMKTTGLNTYLTTN